MFKFNTICDMNKIKLKDKEFQIAIHYDSIYQSIKQIAANINHDFQDKETPVFLSILNGAFMFTADLFKELRIDAHLSFVKFASYQGMNSTGDVKQLIGLNEDLKEKNIIVLEDIVDSGLTISKITEQLRHYNPKELKIATLLLKPDVYQGKIPLDYVGMEIPNEFIVGYGLDYDGLGRNYKNIYKVVS